MSMFRQAQQAAMLSV